MQTHVFSINSTAATLLPQVILVVLIALAVVAAIGVARELILALTRRTETNDSPEQRHDWSFAATASAASRFALPASEELREETEESAENLDRLQEELSSIDDARVSTRRQKHP